MKKDCAVIGSGLFGSIVARELKDKGFSVDVFEQRDHIGGNCYSEKINGIHVNKYGGHIFHTNNKEIWDYINRFTKFRNYHHIVRVNFRDKIYSFPINLGTLNELWGTKTPEEALVKLRSVKHTIQDINNLEDWCLSEVGQEIYETFIKGYTIKQWKKNPKELPSFIIKRLPIRLTYQNGYFEDEYQGFPENGFTSLFESLLENIGLNLNFNYFEHSSYVRENYKTVVYTGKIDEFYDYRFGELEYRTLKFNYETHKGDYQGCATINYTDESVPFTRIVEFKHFQPHKMFDTTIIMKEYPDEWDKTKIPYYPINNDQNNKLYNQYKALADQESNTIFGGRLAEYKYYDMHQIVGSALKTVPKIVSLIQNV